MAFQKVAVIGSGNWGSTIAKIIAENIKKCPEMNQTVNMWVYEELVDGKKLTDIINKERENVKYLPGIRLPENIHAEPKLTDAVKDATCLVFVVPHQFVHKVCKELKGSIDPQNCRAISLIKGMDMSSKKIHLITDMIREDLGIDTSILSGANIASEVAKGYFCESTLGYNKKENALIFKQLLQTPNFRISAVPDVGGVEICGALKNVVALAAGISDGLGYGDNTKAAIIRLGLLEMKNFAKMNYDGVLDETFFESCGIADVITSCSGGRNRKVAEAYVKTRKLFDVLEKELLNGQKLQGTLTAMEVHAILEEKGQLDKFPLMTAVYEIVYKDRAPETLLHGFSSE